MSRHLDTRASNAGFTLVEVIVSFIILSTVLGSVTLSLSYSARLHRNAEARRLAVACAERVLAEKFHKRRDLPGVEEGADLMECRWRIVRRIAKAGFTDSGRNLIAFHLEIFGHEGKAIDSFVSYYVEALP